MATRTKSFFDQDQRKPRPGQWTRRPYTANNTYYLPPVAPPPKPPIPATSQAKTKLKAFQFVPGETEEKRSSPSAEVDEMAQGSGNAVRTSDSAPSSNSIHRTPQIPHTNTFPCTPGARLPIEDLIGDCDETNKPAPIQRSPEEQIGWIPNSSNELLTPNKRKRKRAKSSSPPGPHSSSQPDRTSAFFGENGAPSTAKKTPAADPAADLWQRYASGKATGESMKLPEISNLIFQGSPRPIETPVKSGPFRRWASTGNDWPSTKNKRRCTTGRQSINVWQDQTVAESNGKTKVATMVQKIQESLATQRLEQEKSKAVAKTLDAPSSSSPLPDMGAENFPTPNTTSPLQTRQPNMRSPAKAANALPRILEKPPSQSVPSQRPPSRQNIRPTQSGGVRSDYARSVGDPLNPGAPSALHLGSRAPLPAYKRPSITRPPSQPKVPQVVAPPPPADEFGDDAFDLTADDLDELLSQKPLDQRSLYDIPAYAQPPPARSVLADQRPTMPQGHQDAIVLDDDDEFGGDDIDDDSFAQAEFTATQTLRKSPRKRSPRKGRSPRKSRTTQDRPANSQTVGSTPRLHRYVVKQVICGEYTNDKGRTCEEKVLLGEHERTSKSTAIALRGSWTATPVAKNDIVHLTYLRRTQVAINAAASPPSQVTVSDEEDSPFLIVHPDHMLSATTVADSFDCIRKAVLQDRIKATGETSKAMVYGSILHEIFQQALSSNQWDSTFLSQLVERTVQAHVEGLWELGMRDTVMAVEEVTAKMGELGAWAKVFVTAQPGSDALVDDRNGEKVQMAVSKLIAIEEHIWSPQFGLKGNVDATVQTTLHDGVDTKKLIVPFEVKTGRTTQSPAHRAQTALYTLLLSDRYDVAVEAGILYYLESSSMSRIAPPLMEVRQMVQQRNRLAALIFHARHPTKATAPTIEAPSSSPDEYGDIDMSEEKPEAMPTQEIEESGLPSLLKNPFKCGRCYAQQSCFTYHALVEKGSADSAGMVDDKKKNHSLTWNEAVGHLLGSCTDRDQAEMLKQWFSKWDRLLTFEESEQARYKKEIWTMPSNEREAHGRCFGNLVVVRDLTNAATNMTQQVVDGIEGSGGKINRFAYVFTRASATQGVSFTEGSQLHLGEPVVVSSEQGQWALANGYVVAISRHEITVAVDRRLGSSRQRLEGFHDLTNQAFKGTMTVGKENEAPPAAGEEHQLYRLDKDEFSNGLALVRNNLVNLMSGHPIHTKLRQQVVFNSEPTFKTSSTARVAQPTQLGDMNEDQQNAVAKVLAADDYALILGMPGTGKTTTIAHMIRALLAQDQSILLTSYTHTAVDNILLKIRDIAPAGSILRLGVPAKINTQVQEFCQLAATPRTSIDEIDAAYMETKIVATTCMGTNHALFQRRSFDVCIVDEASQITLPTILGPLLHARKFVLVGDHFQLPPLVQNRNALEGGLDISLFRQLSEQHPEAVAALGRQYRMCEEIMMLSNELIYHGQLRCGNENVAQRTLQCSHGQGVLDKYHRSSTTQTTCTSDSTCWLRHATDPNRKVIYANTDALGKTALETLTSGKNITNHLEATIAAQLVLTLLAMGVPPSEIGVITLYRSQLALIRQLFKKAGIPSDVEIDSADRFQGRDKECIILSMVRANDQGIVGDLLKDWRRVNVALTRARSKMVVLGHGKTLKHNDLLRKFLALVERERWVLDLPREADEMHALNSSTQVTQQLVMDNASPADKRRLQLSPAKKIGSQLSPSKQDRILQPSQSAANRSPVKKSSQGKSGGVKRIDGRLTAGSTAGKKMRMMREQIAVEDFEDLTGEEF